MEEIEETHIQKKEPIFIDYSKIFGNSEKRLLFLRALIRIIDMRANFVKYSDLGLLSSDIEHFKHYLNENYSKYFETRKNKINLYENYDGKIIFNVDLLIEDICNLINDNNQLLMSDSGGISQSATKRKESITSEIKDNSKKNIDEIFYEWVFLVEYNQYTFEDEIKYILKEFYSINESEVKKIFTTEKVLNEFFKNIYSSHRKKIRFSQFRYKILTCLEDFEKKCPDTTYWSSLQIKIKKLFICLINSETLSKKSNKKLFLTYSGDLNIQNINKVISKYQNRAVIFSYHSPLFERLEANQIILGEIIEERDNYIMVNPERILDTNEAKVLLFFGMEAFPTNQIVQLFLEKI